MRVSFSSASSAETQPLESYGSAIEPIDVSTTSNVDVVDKKPTFLVHNDDTWVHSTDIERIYRFTTKNGEKVDVPFNELTEKVRFSSTSFKRKFESSDVSKKIPRLLYVLSQPENKTLHHMFEMVCDLADDTIPSFIYHSIDKSSQFGRVSSSVKELQHSLEPL
jgi:hypothetical protein